MPVPIAFPGNRSVDTGNVYTPNIHHRPLKQILPGHRHDFVVHPVLISIYLNEQLFPETVHVGLPADPQVPLLYIFRFELCIAHKGVIQIVEGGRTETVFIKGTNLQGDAVERLNRQHNGGG